MAMKFYSICAEGKTKSGLFIHLRLGALTMCQVVW